MGHIRIPASELIVSLSEDAGERSGISLSRQELVDHLREGCAVRTAFAGSDETICISSADYEDAVGDLLYALGTTDQPGMPTLGQRLMVGLGENGRSFLGLEALLKVEAIASHWLRRRNETGALARDALHADLEDVIGDRRHGSWTLSSRPVSVHLAHCPFFTREIKAADPVTLTALYHRVVPSSGIAKQKSMQNQYVV